MKSKILVVDDEENIRYTFKFFLNMEGYEVHTTGDCESALELIECNDFDLIFADVILGDSTGVNILSKVKETGSGCPVIMITGKPSIDTAADSVRLGAFDYLSKPIRKDILIRSTRLALEHKALMDDKKRVEEENTNYRRHLEAIFRSESVLAKLQCEPVTCTVFIKPSYIKRSVV